MSSDLEILVPQSGNSGSITVEYKEFGVRLSVTPTVCSYCAVSDRSRVTAVQPSESTFTCGLPRLIIGSMVKIMPSRSSGPSFDLP